MEIKITKKLLSIPPYISTKWDYIFSIGMKENILIVKLEDGSSVEVPALSEEQIKEIFSIHASLIEEEEPLPPVKSNSPFSLEFNEEADNPAAKMSFAAFDEFGAVMQHNPDQANAAPLPPQILEKIATLAKVMSPDEMSAIPKAEPHCNCIHCQITRTILKHEAEGEITGNEEEVTDDDLQFQQWEIEQNGDRMFTVINRLDQAEHYTVHLGEPVGCTCGKDGCEHIVAVLKS